MNDNKAGVRRKGTPKSDAAKADRVSTPEHAEQDTPGRHKSTGSRQQTHANQKSATGSPELDRESGKKHRAG